MQRGPRPPCLHAEAGEAEARAQTSQEIVLPRLLLVLVMLINMVIALVVLPLLVWLIKPKFVSSKDILVLGEGIDVGKLLAEEESREKKGASGSSNLAVAAVDS